VGLLPADRAPVPGEDPSLYGEATVDVVDDDVSNVFLSLSPAARLTGRVVFPTGTPPSSALFRLRLVRPLRPSAPNANDAASPTALVRPDGTFDFASVRPGSYRLTAMTPPPGWLPATALVNGRDALDVPFTVGPANASPIELTMTDRHASLTGRLVEASGAPATGYFVVIFSTDRDTWLPESRRMRSARPGTDGTFRFEDVVPGEYYLAALTDADSAAWQAPAFLLDAAAAAVKVTIADGGRATQDLRVGR
jgi:hypothetical protein